MHQLINHHAFIVLEDLVAQFLAHALVDNHVAGHFGGILQIVASAGGNPVFAQHDFFGDTAAKPRASISLNWMSDTNTRSSGGINQVTPPAAAARDNGDFVYRIAIWQYMADYGVASFVVGGG